MKLIDLSLEVYRVTWLREKDRMEMSAQKVDMHCRLRTQVVRSCSRLDYYIEGNSNGRTSVSIQRALICTCVVGRVVWEAEKCIESSGIVYANLQ